MSPALRLLAALLAIGLAAAARPAGAGDVRPFVRGSWAEIRASHQGRPLIVHLWGLTCPPCRAEMPEWGKLLAEKPAVGIVILHAERLPPDAGLIGEMLADTGLRAADNWAFRDSFLAKLRYEIDPKWQGELPMTLMIAADGRTEAVIGPADLAHVRRWIAAQPPRPN